MENREQLEQQLKDLEAQKVTLFDSGSADPVEVGRINEKIKATQQQLNAIERDEVIEEKIHADEIPFAVSGVDMVGMPVEVIQFVEEVVKTDRKRIYNEHAIELEQLEAKLKECEDVGIERALEINRLESYAKSREHELLETIGNVQSEVYRLTSELADAEQKRDAAVKQRDEADEELRQANAENERLRAKIAEYEQANAYAERQEQPLTVSPEESTSLQEKADAVKKLFISRENWGPVDKLTLPDGSYKVVKRSEVEDNWEEATVPEIAQETAESIEVPEQSFREEDAEDAGCTLDRDEIVSESNEDTSGEPKSIEQILTDYRVRLERLEEYCFTPTNAIAS